ncbi:MULTISPECIES: energy-coupling factor transporter transmembrane component T family protein [Gordonibacter]|uniref:Energy-coupling factor transporter transmembrane component T n=1 Tax=Gordonibacter faecis TaxID=3047475 RepID=A0ABT7DIN6_9ACTN|nr:MULTISPECIES: energy-coupling factor transporter transmembrane component T [unclassified Gordonibacter]MDJ1649393.1 energy-coupling factor transporter transmembrane component T [Gordonibacter sp. KGMB12511]
MDNNDSIPQATVHTVAPQANSGACTASFSGRMAPRQVLALDAAEAKRTSVTFRRLDPRVALGIVLLLNVTAFSSSSILFELAAMGGSAAAMCWSGRTRSALRWLVAYAALLMLSTLFVAGGGLLAPFGASVTMIRRVLCIAAFASNMVATTRAGELACGLQRLRVPRKMACALCVMLRFFPTLGQEFRCVLDAMKVRGVALTPLRLLRHPLQVIEHVLVPVVARVGIVADELANAAVVRGIDSDASRTSYFDLRIRPCDFVFAVYFAALTVLVVATRWGVLV